MIDERQTLWMIWIYLNNSNASIIMMLLYLYIILWLWLVIYQIDSIYNMNFDAKFIAGRFGVQDEEVQPPAVPVHSEGVHGAPSPGVVAQTMKWFCFSNDLENFGKDPAEHTGFGNDYWFDASILLLFNEWTFGVSWWHCICLEMSWVLFEWL